jgi:hypothetical protein
MGVTVGVNKMSVVHKASGGLSVASLDVCKAPPPVVPGPPFIPLPLFNIARSSDLAGGTRKVKCDGQSVAIDGCVLSKSTGDEAGSLRGIASGTNKGKAEFLSFSFDVKFEGKGVARALDIMMHNDKNTMIAPILQRPVAAAAGASGDEGEEDDGDECSLCGKRH